MTAALVASILGALGVAGILAATLFWQLKRAAKSADKWSSGVEKVAEQQILLAAAKVAVADKERAMNLLIVDRDGLQGALGVVKRQRDELLKDALEHATPSTIATSIRDALERLRDLQPEVSEARSLPDVPSGADDNG